MMAASSSLYKHDSSRYLRAKIIITILRFLAYMKMIRNIRRDSYLPPNMVLEKIQIPSRDSHRTIEAHIYYPPGYDPSSSPPPLPVLINWHASGFILPQLGTDRAYCMRMARDAGIIVVDSDYRKGPENIFPAAVHDAVDTVRWVYSHPDRFDINSIALSGFSSGGNLALVTSAMSASSLKDVRINAVILYYPITNFTLDPASRVRQDINNRLAISLVRLIYSCYVPEMSMRKDVRASPILDDPSFFPETVVIFTCEGDNIDLEAEKLAREIDDGSRTVVLRRLKAIGHNWDKGVTKGSTYEKMRDEAYGETVEILKKLG
ncbi:Alpha/Beta hydrolase protein [Talaromyces proteolyticus]|uniref:Alpha/Beta hydrolase protein n=1 Tax=Talaromyces proteolyticus TaxID=1131652 RepID=A0AAD4KNX6_9EURO|nr:Alpha/Beta hydrolase protein [Talaromyces proteolyticus]KAH8695664.1 Alpha/Beta hydrolase protein [Talaromyces proteolyticus]